jgi:hypothetical protein
MCGIFVPEGRLKVHLSCYESGDAGEHVSGFGHTHRNRKPEAGDHVPVALWPSRTEQSPSE